MPIRERTGQGVEFFRVQNGAKMQNRNERCSPAERMQRTRNRRRVGRRVLMVECDDDAVDWLLDWLGVIPPVDDSAERQQTALTIGRLIDSLPSLVARNATRR